MPDRGLGSVPGQHERRVVERQADPNDRRARLATLTAAGRKACREGLRVQQAAEQKVLRKLSAAESRMLADLLAKVADR